MKKLQDKDFEKFSALTGVSMVEIQKLHAFGAFDESLIIDHLIRYDFKRLRKGGRYTVKQICAAIAEEYQVSLSKVHNAIYDKRRREAVCSKCGRVVKRAELNRNQGVCDICVIDSIEL